MEIILKQACTAKISLTFKDKITGAVLNLTGCTFASWMMKDGETTAEVEFDVDDTDAATGVIVLEATAEEMDIEIGTYCWDVLMKDTDDIIHRIVDNGTVVVNRTISRFP